MGQLPSLPVGKHSRLEFDKVVDAATSNSTTKSNIDYFPKLHIGLDDEDIFSSENLDLVFSNRASKFQGHNYPENTEPDPVQDQTHEYNTNFKHHNLPRRENIFSERGNSGANKTITNTRTIRTALSNEIHSLLRSASLDDISYVTSYSKNTHHTTLSDYNSDNEGYSFRSSNGHKINLRPGMSTRRSAEHISSLKPSSAYRSSLRPSASYRTSSHSYQPLSQQDSKPKIVGGSISSKKSNNSSVWSPTSEATEDYRIALITNPHFCTYGCKDLTFKRKSQWARHEEEHELPTLYTCLLHISEDFESSPCPGRYCVSVMDFDHLAYFHDSLICFEKPSLSIERYQTDKKDDLLDHLRERHELELDSLPDYWSSDPQRSWRCGFCGGTLNLWRERVDHISLHFTREGVTLENWKSDVNMLDERKESEETSFMSTKRLSIVEEY